MGVASLLQECAHNYYVIGSVTIFRSIALHNVGEISCN